MALHQFQCDKRLWVAASLVLFVVSLWIPWVMNPVSGTSMVSPVGLARSMSDASRRLRSEMPRFDANERDFVGDYLRSTFFFGPPVLFSVLLGWVIQSGVVMLRSKGLTRNLIEANRPLDR